MCLIASIETKEVTNLNIYYHFNLLVILDVNYCYEPFNPCSVNGQCVSPLGANAAQCICNPGFFGNLCQCK